MHVFQYCSKRNFFYHFLISIRKKEGGLKFVCVSPINHGLVAHLVPYITWTSNVKIHPFFLDTEWNIESRIKSQNLLPQILPRQNYRAM